MSPEIDLQAIASRRIVYGIPRTVTKREHLYRAADGSSQPMDVYSLADSEVAQPAVIMIGGYPDAGMQRIFGRRSKDMGSNVSWAQLMAASGLIVVSYANVKPVEDATNVLQHVRDHAPALGIDGDRIGLWSSSGSVPNALGLLIGAGRHSVKCAALLFGYMLDMDGSMTVKEMSKFGFVTPAAGKSVDDLPRHVPLFIARAGLDEMPGLNATIDAFVVRALVGNFPIAFANHPEGPHAFDAVHDSDATRQIIRQILMFLTGHLLRQTGG